MLQSGWFEMISFEDLLLEHTFEEDISGFTRLCILGLGNPNFPDAVSYLSNLRRTMYICINTPIGAINTA
jgi:hypothetical protein